MAVMAAMAAMAALAAMAANGSNIVLLVFFSANSQWDPLGKNKTRLTGSNKNGGGGWRKITQIGVGGGGLDS